MSKIKKLTAIGDHVILKVTANSEKLKSGIYLPDTALDPQMKAAKERRKLMLDIEVYSVGEKVEKTQVGDFVEIKGHVLNQRLMIEDIYKDDKTPENIRYYWCEEKDIICKV